MIIAIILFFIGLIVAGNMYDARLDDRTYDPVTVDARAPERASSDKIMRVADVAEGRMRGHTGGTITVSVDPAVTRYMDSDTRTNLHWLQREGKDLNIEVKL